MKKTLLFTVTLLLFTKLSYSQIELKSTIESSIFIKFFKLENGETKYYGFDPENFILNVYNLDHSIYTNINIDKDALNRYNDDGDSFIAAVSQKIFDGDDGIEFVLYSETYESGTSEANEKTFIIDDNGSILFEKDDQFPQVNSKDNETLQTPNWIQKTESGWFMILTEKNDSSLTTDDLFKKYIYALPGTSTLSNKEVSKTDISLKAYPNPSLNYINLDYKLPYGVTSGKILIHNLNGVQERELKIDNHVSSLKISNQDLASGIYTYTVVAGSYKSKPLKIIIK